MIPEGETAPYGDLGQPGVEIHATSSRVTKLFIRACLVWPPCICERGLKHCTRVQLVLVVFSAFLFLSDLRYLSSTFICIIGSKIV